LRNSESSGGLAAALPVPQSISLANFSSEDYIVVQTVDGARLVNISLSNSTLAAAQALNDSTLQISAVSMSLLNTVGSNSWAGLNGNFTWQEMVYSSVINISLFSGMASVPLKGNITFLFDIDMDNLGGVCLAYIDEVKLQWVCQDNNLIWMGDDWNNIVFGQTNHLTSFAIIVSPDPYTPPRTFSSAPPAWLVAVAVLASFFGAVILVIFVVLLLKTRTTKGYFPQGEETPYRKFTGDAK